MTATFIDRVIERANARFCADAAKPRPFPWSRSGWMWTGSAGQAMTWFEQAVARHPDDPFAVVAALDARIHTETTNRPLWFTKRHLREVLDIVREEARATVSQAVVVVVDGKEHFYGAFATETAAREFADGFEEPMFCRREEVQG